MSVLTLGTAGHIDHGKTSLIEALTGTNTDRLAEERRRGISIELGYARLDLGDLELSVVDVPGHERFVRTMVAGATGIDLALVCVACDDGVMPQTREHVAILELLGVARGVVALTKRDLVDDESAELAREDVAELLETTPLRAAAVVEVSVRGGRGLDELRAALRSAAAGVVRRPAAGRARLPIDRVFSLRGIGTVVTGTLWSGRLAVGDRVTLVPGGRTARIRSLQAHDADAEAVYGGGRVAAGLVGVERREVERGDVLVVGPPPPRSFRLDGRLHALPDAAGLRHGERVEALHGTRSVPARVVLLDGAAVRGGETALAQLRLDRPLAALRGDRVVLRTLAPPDTVAGLTVLDPRPRRHGADAAALARLGLLAGADASAVVLAAAATAPVAAAGTVDDGLLEPGAAAAAVEALVTGGRLVALDGDLVLARERLDAVAATARERLAARVEASPLEPSLTLAEALPIARGRDAVAARLERDGIVARGGRGLALPGVAARSEAAGTAAKTLVERLAAEPFAPPRLDDALAGLGLDAAAQRALVAALEREGELVRLPDGLALTRGAYDEARRIVEDGCGRNGRFTLAELRDATGSSRRYAQAILERLDADGVTRRVGDFRVLRRRRPDGAAAAEGGRS
jgi:selenocysteine-specific elongation factor